MQQKPDIYTTVTDNIIAAIEAGQTGDKFILPWDCQLVMPMNATNGKQYRGVNVLILWAAQQAGGYAVSEWATYKQWQERGAQVRNPPAAVAVCW